MIDTKELRLKNIVRLFDGEIGTVVSIGLSSVDLKEVNFYIINTGISPIELTPEVLQACGFEIVIYGYGTPYKYKKYEHKSGYFFYGSEMSSIYHNSGEVVYICSASTLHKLQNVYYCLTDEELTIDIDKLKNAVK